MLYRRDVILCVSIVSLLDYIDVYSFHMPPFLDA